MINSAEAIFAEWLTRQGCQWIYVNQDPGQSADGSLRTNVEKILHRPDFLLFLNSFGTIAVDVKAYTPKSIHLVVGEASQEWHDPETVTADYVYLYWDDVEGLYNFEQVSNIPTWICLFKKLESSGDIRYAYFYRVSEIHKRYGAYYDMEKVKLINHDNVSVPRCVDGGPDISQCIVDTINEKKKVFCFYVEDVELYSVLPINTPFGARRVSEGEYFFIEPIIVDIMDGGSVIDLISIRTNFVESPPTDQQMSYALVISKALSKNMPMLLTKRTVSNFIELNVGSYKKIKNG